MKIEKQLLRILLIFISIVAIYNIKSYCGVTGTWRMEIRPPQDDNEKPWSDINISNVYKECESLNSATSTLGTNNLRAHLTTDADWSAMAIFSISQYGGTTSNAPTTTTENESGVYNPGKNYTYTTGILNTATKDSDGYVSGLFNEDGTLKSYMRQWSPTRTDNDFISFKDLQNGGTFGWFGSWKYWNLDTTYKHFFPVKKGLFGITASNGDRVTCVGYGWVKSDVTFRPVIWN